VHGNAEVAGHPGLAQMRDDGEMSDVVEARQEDGSDITTAQVLAQGREGVGRLVEGVDEHATKLHSFESRVFKQSPPQPHLLTDVRPSG